MSEHPSDKVIYPRLWRELSPLLNSGAAPPTYALSGVQKVLLIVLLLVNLSLYYAAGALAARDGYSWRVYAPHGSAIGLTMMFITWAIFILAPNRISTSEQMLCGVICLLGLILSVSAFVCNIAGLFLH